MDILGILRDNVLFQLMWSADIWTSYVTSWHILLFALFRFISIYWPHRFLSFTLKRTKVGGTKYSHFKIMVDINSLSYSVVLSTAYVTLDVKCV